MPCDSATNYFVENLDSYTWGYCMDSIDLVKIPIEYNKYYNVLFKRKKNDSFQEFIAYSISPKPNDFINSKIGQSRTIIFHKGPPGFYVYKDKDDGYISKETLENKYHDIVNFIHKKNRVTDPFEYYKYDDVGTPNRWSKKFGDSIDETIPIKDIAAFYYNYEKSDFYIHLIHENTKPNKTVDIIWKETEEQINYSYIPIIVWMSWYE